MSACKTLARAALLSLECGLRINEPKCSSSLRFASFLSESQSFSPVRVLSRSYCAVEGSVSAEVTDVRDVTVSAISSLEPLEDLSKDTVEELITNENDVARFMKMERRSKLCDGPQPSESRHWFPYFDQFKAGSTFLNSGEILEALDPYIMDVRKERFRLAVNNRSYSVCLVIEGLSDFGNVSAAFRSADALGFQSVHVVSCDSSKRCSMI